MFVDTKGGFDKNQVPKRSQNNFNKLIDWLTKYVNESYENKINW